MLKYRKGIECEPTQQDDLGLQKSSYISNPNGIGKTDLVVLAEYTPGKLVIPRS